MAYALGYPDGDGLGSPSGQSASGWNILSAGAYVAALKNLPPLSSSTPQAMGRWAGLVEISLWAAIRNLSDKYLLKTLENGDLYSQVTGFGGLTMLTAAIAVPVPEVAAAALLLSTVVGLTLGAYGALDTSGVPAEYTAVTVGIEQAITSGDMDCIGALLASGRIFMSTNGGASPSSGRPLADSPANLRTVWEGYVEQSTQYIVPERTSTGQFGNWVPLSSVIGPPDILPRSA